MNFWDVMSLSMRTVDLIYWRSIRILLCLLTLRLKKRCCPNWQKIRSISHWGYFKDRTLNTMPIIARNMGMICYTAKKQDFTTISTMRADRQYRQKLELKLRSMDYCCNQAKKSASKFAKTD